jgi:hypothetical protein
MLRIATLRHDRYSPLSLGSREIIGQRDLELLASLIGKQRGSGITSPGGTAPCDIVLLH